MPLDVSGKWLGKLKQKEIKPVFVLAIAGAKYSFSTGKVQNPSHSPPYKILVTGALQMPTGLRSTIMPKDGKFTMGSLTLRILNINNYIYDIIAGGTKDGTGSQGFNTFANIDVVLRLGFDGLDYDDYIVVFQGHLNTVKIPEPNVVEMTFLSKLKYMRKQIMTNCDGTSGNEVKIKGNPINIWVRIMVNNFATSGKGSLIANYPIDSVTGNPTGLGYIIQDLDETDIQNERDIWMPNTTVEYQWRDPIDGKAWMEEQFFQLWGFPITKRGSIRTKTSLRLFHPIQPPATPIQWNNKKLIGFPDWERRYDQLLNRVKIYGDWDPDAADPDDEWTELANEETPNSAFTETAISETYFLEFKSKGLRTSENGVTIATAMAQRILSRYGHGGPEKISGNVKFTELDIEPMDLIALTIDALPDYMTYRADGKVEELFEVVGIAPNFKKASIKVELLKSYRKRAAFIHATNSPADYTAASEEEKYYAYISDSDGKMSNGDDGYYIC